MPADDVHAAQQAVAARVKGEETSVAQLPFEYVKRCTRNFTHGSVFEFDFDEYCPDAKLFNSWDLYGGMLTPTLVVARCFTSKDAAKIVEGVIHQAQALKCPQLRKFYGECRIGRLSDSLHHKLGVPPNASHIWLTVVEMPAKHHSVQALAAKHGSDPDWIDAVVAGVRKACEALRPIGCVPLISPASVFLRNGKIDDVFVGHIVHSTSGTETERKLSAFRGEIEKLAGHHVPWMSRYNSVNADDILSAGPSMDTFDDEDDIPIAFTKVQNCPIVVNVACAQCRRSICSAGYHLRGADCSNADEHFLCEDCVTRHFTEMLQRGETDVDKMPCPLSCSGSFDFDDFAALLAPPVIARWNKMCREKVLKQVQEEMRQRK